MFARQAPDGRFLEDETCLGIANPDSDEKGARLVRVGRLVGRMAFEGIVARHGRLVCAKSPESAPRPCRESAYVSPILLSAYGCRLWTFREPFLSFE